MLILEGHRGKVHSLAFAPDGRTLASAAGRSRAVQLWDLEAGKVRTELGGHTHRVVALACAAHPKPVLASGDSSGRIKLRRPDDGKPAARDIEQAHVPWVGDLRLAFTPDGETLALCGRPVGVAVWAPWGERRGRWHDTGQGYVSCLAFSPDGRTLATGSHDWSVKLWALPGIKPAGGLCHGRTVHHLTFSPDGRTLASAGMNGLVKLWDAETGRKRTTLKGQSRELHGICYSPDGRTLATAAGDGAVRFWDVETGKCRRAFDWGVGACHSVAFAPDGLRAAAAGEGRIVVWDIDDWGM
jgi:WD40 repeat protein